MKREAPPIVTIGLFDVDYEFNTIYVEDEGYWTGDYIQIRDTSGEPYNINYSNPLGKYYCHRDKLDRISLYVNRSHAMRGLKANRILLRDTVFTNFTITSLVAESWFVQGELVEWTLELNAADLDTTSIGDKFGESVKALVTGGGTMDFLVERYDRTSHDPTDLMKLLLLTTQGSKAQADFYMYEDRAGGEDYIPGDLYYTTELLITNVAINTRAAELIAGSISFVTIGEIDLIIDPEQNVLPSVDEYYSEMTVQLFEWRWPVYIDWWGI